VFLDTGTDFDSGFGTGTPPSTGTGIDTPTTADPTGPVSRVTPIGGGPTGGDTPPRLRGEEELPEDDDDDPFALGFTALESQFDSGIPSAEELFNRR